MSCITMNGDRVLPGGYCSGGCVENIDCGAGAACIGGFGGAATGYCYKSCSAVADCRTGYACEDLGFGAAAMGGMGMPGAAAATTVCTLPMIDEADAGMP